ncbi:MAG: hypothetical protein JSW54_07555 [Fidelibacterota bacterium]|nr:MAG: hypothetical protein JSW54_07555 [Candidatus Neomarinimicrobiota bacterium]
MDDLISNAINSAPYIVLATLCLYLPLTALTYLCFRRRRRKAEIERIFAILELNLERNNKNNKTYQDKWAGLYYEAYEDKWAWIYYVMAVIYSTGISLIGLSLLLLGSRIGFPCYEFPSVSVGGIAFPQAGSRLVFGMAFLGAYLWGLQHVFHRYATNDLTPGVYYTLSIRLIFASLIALVIYNGYAALAGESQSSSGITWIIWPALALLIGMFPRRGLRYLTERLPIISAAPNPSVREMPLEMIEGITTHDRLRLEELGIDTCYDLATADFVPLILKTPYSARELIDWILQAKLCVYFGEVVKDLRERSIRTALDLKRLAPQDIPALAEETATTKPALERAKESIEHDIEIERLCKVGLLLSRYSAIKDEELPSPESCSSPRKERDRSKGRSRRRR